MGCSSNDRCRCYTPDPCGGAQNEFSPQFYSAEQLDRIPQLLPRIPAPQPICITVQQPPRLACKKRIIFINKTVPQPVVVNRCKQVMIPKIVEVTKVVKVPKLEWVPQLTTEKKVVNHAIMQQDPHVVCQSRSFYEPREIYQMVTCQPKPQVIQIPTPNENSCYPIGPTKYNPNFCSSKFDSGCNFYGPLHCSPGYGLHPPCGSYRLNSCQEQNLRPAERPSVGYSDFPTSLPKGPYIPSVSSTTECGSNTKCVSGNTLQNLGRNCKPYPNPFITYRPLIRCAC